jgi:hypothetical protein
LTQILPGIPYDLPLHKYGEMFDLSIADNDTRVAIPDTWEKCYKILKDSYDFFGALGDNYQMKVEWSGSVLTVSVRKDGSQGYTKVYQGTPPRNIGASNRLHLQSHWGSGVTFGNLSIS